MKHLKYQTLGYVQMEPKDFDPSKKHPALIFLHGAGTRGNDLLQVEGNPFFKDVAQLERFPFVVFAPQCHADTWFDLFEQLIGFAGMVRELDYVDENRVYLIGASMGGYGTWQLAMSRPDWFAAIVPICGGGMYWNAGRLKKVPVWAFHGAKDTTVLPEESQKMVDKAQKAGCDARLTIYPEAAHNAWDDTYLNQQVFDWMLEHTAQGEITEKTQLNGSGIYG